MIRSNVQHVFSKVAITIRRQRQRLLVHHIFYRCPSTTSGLFTQKQCQSSSTISFSNVGNEHFSKSRCGSRIPLTNECTLMNQRPTISVILNPYHVVDVPRRYMSNNNKKNKNDRTTSNESSRSSPSRLTFADFGDDDDEDFDHFGDTPSPGTTGGTAVHPAHFHSGPSLELGLGRLGLHTYASVVAKAGSTTILCTVAREPLDQSNGNSNTSMDSAESFLTVEFRQKSAAVGQIPGNRLRNDQGRMMTSSEVLASRIIDRSLRPLLKVDTETTSGQPPAHYHVLAAVQSIDLWDTKRTGHPIATALNAAAAALAPQLTEPVAATVLAVMSDGSILQDPGPATRQPIQIKRPEGQDDATKKDTTEENMQIEPYCVGELLYAGTRTHAIMIEWTSIHDSLPEDQWPALLELASAAILPIIDTIDELQMLQIEKHENIKIVDKPDGFVSEEETTALTAQIRASLGLPPLDEIDTNSDEEEEESPNEDVVENTDVNRNELLYAAVSFCREQMGENPMHTLFGVRSSGIPTRKDVSMQPVVTHRNPDEILSKRHRGRRETIMNQEIYRLVDVYLTEKAGYKFINDGDSDDETTTILPQSDRKWLQQKVAYILLKHGLWETSFRFGTRADGRRNIHVGQGWKTVRPVQIIVPALPDSVHGSAIFARGDTQVLCTVTLGAPREGQPLSDPYQPTTNPQLAASDIDVSNTPEGEEVSFDKLPIGSLRFLRTQEALESDLNSRKSLADKERTGDSGNLAEVKRAFLQYDFPAYSTGSVPKRGGMDRRSIGHGALAERAVLPVMPEAHIFPYAVRITSEVTDSNGSSSMASVCGATLALRDAGVPLKASVAGVSVGLAVPGKEAIEIFSDDNNSNEQKYSLLLDITGTEDHYGAMDFKIAGTRKGVTAIQLDVKEPLPVSILVEALHLAKAGRIAIIDEMDKKCSESFGSEFGRPEPKALAPRVEVVRFDPQRKRDLVGPGGVVLRQLEDRYGVALDLTQEGQCLLFGANRDMVENAKQTVMDLVAEVVEGETYVGTVIEIKDFGAIIELLRNKEGILHVSEISTDPDAARSHPEGNMGFVRQQLKLGQKIELLCIGVDPVQGSVKLSRKALLEKKKTLNSDFTTTP